METSDNISSTFFVLVAFFPRWKLVGQIVSLRNNRSWKRLELRRQYSRMINQFHDFEQVKLILHYALLSIHNTNIQYAYKLYGILIRSLIILIVEFYSYKGYCMQLWKVTWQINQCHFTKCLLYTTFHFTQCHFCRGYFTQCPFTQCQHNQSQSS